MAWSGSIALNDDQEIKGCTECPYVAKKLTNADIFIEQGHLQKDTLPSKASLRYLSVVERSRIPLYLSLGSPCTVCTSNPETERWFSHVLLAGSADGSPSDSSWWHEAICDSQLGILASVDHSCAYPSTKKPRATEVLFYASRKVPQVRGPSTPPDSSPSCNAAGNRDSLDLRVNALVLSSDLLQHHNPAEATPPCSPQPEPCEAIFLPDLIEPVEETINEPPVRKRKTASEAFDEANERRKKARRKGGEGVAAAAASKADKQLPALQHRRSGSASQIMPLQNRALSRSPSIASSRPTTANRPSTLSKVESNPSASQESATERKNKDIVSRIVMTGMRLHGLTQSNKPTAKDKSSAPSGDGVEDIVEIQRQNDEYKIIYHQVYKGTCIAFRASIRDESLQPFSAQVRDVVDQLLVILCTDPLANGLKSSDDKLTPGGRKAFAANASKEAGSTHHVPVK